MFSLKIQSRSKLHAVLEIFILAATHGFSYKALTPHPPYWEKKTKTKNDLRNTKRILYDMGNFFDANRPSYGLSVFYF